MADEKDFMEGLTDEERAEINAAGADEISTDDDATDDDAAQATGETTATSEQDAVTEEQAEQILPPLRAKAPENAEELFNAISAEEDALAQKFDEGDITAKEYRDGLNKLTAQREELNWSARKADLARELEETAKVNAWHKEVQDFMTTRAAHITKSHAQMVAFDEIVKKVTADPANMTLSDRAQLEKAYKIYVAEANEALGVVQKAQQPPAETPPARPARNIPPTLARVPAAEPETIEGSRFANLDRLAAMDPAAYEAAVAKMSEADRAQFEAVA